MLGRNSLIGSLIGVAGFRRYSLGELESVGGCLLTEHSPVAEHEKIGSIEGIATEMRVIQLLVGREGRIGFVSFFWLALRRR